MTGSCHLVRFGGSSRRHAVDCGLFQGRDEPPHRNVLPPEMRALGDLLVTHGHMDHMGRGPLLVGDFGWRGAVHMTPPTAALAGPMLLDSAKLQARHARQRSRFGGQPVKPLYTEGEVAEFMGRVQVHGYNEPFELDDGVKATFLDAGHVLGSAHVLLEYQGWRAAFSGDIGRWNTGLLPDPQPPASANLIVSESTYADKPSPHLSERVVRERLAEIIQATAARGGKVLIPAFSLAKTQDLIFLLNQMHAAGELPIGMPVYVDSQLSRVVTEIYRQHAASFAERVKRFEREQGRSALEFPSLKFILDRGARSRLRDERWPSVIIAASGMFVGGPSVTHLEDLLPDARNTIVKVGYQATGTNGQRLEQFVGGPSAQRGQFSLGGVHLPVRAGIEHLPYSNHAGPDELIRWDLAVRGHKGDPHHVAIHGSPEALAAKKRALEAHGRHRVEIAAPGRPVVLQ